MPLPPSIHRALLTLACCAPIAAAAQQAAPESGVSRALALDRAARVSNLHYALDLTLTPHAATMPGRETLRFTLSSNAADLPLDFRDGTVTSAALNGSPIPVALVNGHLILPATLLSAGENTAEIAFTARIAKSGAAITRYEDKDDASEYLYSLFVPMDASMAFPCFDQPDLKAAFTLAVTAPAAWTVLGNTAPQHDSPTRTTFPETRPISTYLFAFAAGPWARVHPTPGLPDVYVRRSQLARAQPEIPQLQQITARGMAWLADYFQQPFPFPKYDLVLIPGFPFGGMEHAGATFLREDAVLFRTAPTASDRFGRNTLTLHELTHQWFGDLVTMRWFDDLWLKEGFAQYMAYKALAALEPAQQPWKHFYEDIKPLAYGIDETPGTTPIYQSIPNLKDAKSAYGAIVYQKAPAVLKQLEFRIGIQAFRDGLRLYLKQHAYGNAQWSDLIAAFNAAGAGTAGYSLAAGAHPGSDLDAWADAWILHRGMPEVSLDWSCTSGKIDSVTLQQHDVLGSGFVWPIFNRLTLAYLGQTGIPNKAVRVDWATASYSARQAIGEPCPTYIFANSGDEAYGRFLLDPKGEPAVARELTTAPLDEQDPLHRSQLWGALWDNVHIAKSPPSAYIMLALQNLPREEDETQARIQGGHATAALHFYVSPKTRAALTPHLEAIATERMLHAPTQGLRIVSFRTLTAAAETPSARATLKDLLAARLTPEGVELRPLDRWNLVTKLVSLNDPDAPALFAAEQKTDKSGEGDKYAFAAQAAAPDAVVKQHVFAAYLDDPKAASAKPEDWLTQSLRPFNSWNQQPLTEPYLRRALDQLPAIKRDRKIFFLGAWLGAFLGGQSTPEAEAAVTNWLAQPDIDPDLRLKVLENADELHRTVRIRQAFSE